MPAANDRPGEVYGTTSDGCSDAAYASADFDVTVHGAIPTSCRSNALLIRSCSTSGAANCDVEEGNCSDFARRDHGTAFMLLTEKCFTRNGRIQFRPFEIDTFGAFGPDLKKSFELIAAMRTSRFYLLISLCRRKIPQSSSIAQITTSAKKLSSRRSQPGQVYFFSASAFVPSGSGRSSLREL